MWQPAPAHDIQGELADQGRLEAVTQPSRPQLLQHDDGHDADQSRAATQITIRPHDPETGEEIEKAEVVKGYEYARGQFVTFTADGWYREKDLGRGRGASSRRMGNARPRRREAPG